MAKGKQTAFFCKECGYESAKWMGQCPACKEWNTFVEEPIVKSKSGGISSASSLRERTKPSLISEISLDKDGKCVLFTCHPSSMYRPTDEIDEHTNMC